MATSPTTKSALLSGAAKDDAVGLNGDFTFTIADLLGNDPGGAAKVNVAYGVLLRRRRKRRIRPIRHGTFSTATIITSSRRHLIYDSHRIGATDFQYSVQIGNKGTWSQADVDVTAPAAARWPRALFIENFDGYDRHPSSRRRRLLAAQPTSRAGPVGTVRQRPVPRTGLQWLLQHRHHVWRGRGSVLARHPEQPGPIDLSHVFTDTTAAVDGKTAVLSFDIAMQT